MASRLQNRLTALAVRNMAQPGLYPDGAGLYLQISPGGTKSWILRFMLAGRARQMGLGPLGLVPLAEAREKVRAAKRLLLDGVDPIDARRAARREARLEAASAITFKDAADRYVEAHRAGWRNAKHAAQVTNTLTTYAYPHFGDLPVASVDTGLVLKALEPIWQTKTETATRVRGRIESVLDWATARGYRVGENPARWRGHLAKLLPARGKVQRVRHHPAMPYAELPRFMPMLRAQPGVSARALEFTILTAARTGEVIGARWHEIDLEGRIWIVPGERMKSGRQHRVPLSDTAIDILKKLPRERGNDFVFIGGRKGCALSNMAMLATLKRMERADLTAHGFRSSFRDWGAESTLHPGELLEMALAHVVSDKVEAAYRRGDMFEKRRALLDDWESFCMTPPAERDESETMVAANG